MPKLEQADQAETPLENIAASMTAGADHADGPQKEKVKKNYTDILKQLNRTFYKVSETVPDDDPNFVTMVLLDTKAAQLRTQIKDRIDTNKLTEAKSGAEETINKMQSSKAAVAFHDRYLQDLSPMKTEANQLTLNKDELEQKITTYVAELQSNLAAIDKDMAAGKSDEKIQAELSGLSDRWKSLKKQAEAMELNVNNLLRKLSGLHQEAYLLLPPQERPGAKPQPTGPTAPTVARDEQRMRDKG